MFTKENAAVPIEAVLAAISKVLHENLGSRFDLEISERDREDYSNELVHRIEINLTIESPIIEIENQPKKNRHRHDKNNETLHNN